MTDDVARLTELNTRFIDACQRSSGTHPKTTPPLSAPCRSGSWTDLKPILSPGFTYMDGRTGQVDDLEKYAKDLDGVTDLSLAIDQVVVHVDGDAAIVAARTTSDTRPGRFNRYLDPYERRAGGGGGIHEQ